MLNVAYIASDNRIVLFGASAADESASISRITTGTITPVRSVVFA